MLDDLKPDGYPAEGDTFSQTGIVQGAPPVITEEPQKQEAAPEQAPAVQETPQDPVKERNFRSMREAFDRTARERDDLLRKNQEYERLYNQQQQPQQSKQLVEPDLDIDFEFNVKDDELLEGKHLQKIKSAMKSLQSQQKAFQEQQKALQRQTHEASAETRLRTQYSDFDRVMTQENIQLLSRSYPEVARAIDSSPDLYTKASSVYTLIKQFGIHEDQPYAADKDRALANTVKPKPLASIAPQQGDSPLSRANVFANGLTEDLKKHLRAEMAAASRKY